MDSKIVKRILAVAFTAAALALSACGTTEPEAHEPELATKSSTTTSSSSSPATTETSETSETSTSASISVEPVPEPEPEPAAPPVAPETFAEPPQHVEPIWTEPGVGYQCMGTDAWVSDPAYCTSQNLGGETSYDELWGPEAAIPAEEALRNSTTSPYDDGEHCAAAICGYGTNSQGQPNPTSGELQTLHGCQEGYIDDPELCAAVAWVEHHEY